MALIIRCLILILLCTSWYSCSSTPTLISRDYRTQQDFLVDYLKIPKLEEPPQIPEITYDQRHYALEFVPVKLPPQVAFVITRDFNVDSTNKLIFQIQRNEDYDKLGAETLILKEFIDALFDFTDSPEQGVEFYSRILLDDSNALEEHIRRRIRNIDFQPAATFLDDFYQSLYLPSLRRSLAFTAKWRRFEQNSQERVAENKVRWGEIITSWLLRKDLEKLTLLAVQQNFTPSLGHYFKRLSSSKREGQSDKVIMFYPLTEKYEGEVDYVADGPKDLAEFLISSNEGLVDLVKNHSEWENKSLFLSLYTTLDDASKRGPEGVAAVLVERDLLLPQNQGLFTPNIWLYPIALSKKQVLFRATLKDLRLSKDRSNKTRLRYFLPKSEKYELMEHYDSREEFMHMARSFYFSYYRELL